MTVRVGVVGGGLAGVAAALRCADAGARVTLWESRARLGGVAGSFRRGELDVDTGQHVVLRCCTSYLAFLDRLGVRDDVTLQNRLDIPVLSPGARPARLRRNGLPAPLHLGAALLRYAPLALTDRLRVLRAALALGRVDPTSAATDARSFADWLAAHGQSPRAVEALWDLVGIATLNARAADASLALAATVFQLGLLTDAAAGDVGWARVPLGRLHDDAARAALTAAGVEVRTSAKVRSLTAGPDGWRVAVTPRHDTHTRTHTQAGPGGSGSAGEEEFVVDRIVSAVPPTVATRLLPEGAVDLPAGWAERLGSSPIVDVHVVYDRTVLHHDFAAAVDSPVQWVFDRTASSGTSDVHPPGAQYVAVSMSAADDLVGMSLAALRELMLPALAAVLPGAASARVLDFFVTREPHATFRAAPGQAASRPGPVTGLPGLTLAGAWTATGWPATMEGAVRSGEAAAAAALARPVAAAGVAA
ncbi:phytoene dehydrogenase [Pseudonocardia sulfidoxydans NBRC 16205]|uniref:Phytoene dehydrogenase n=1 Tax=Pseudonocardia sulfidoxydans NBRC 16205 TaxID=1223511 RepID=A0A511DAV6_9PSEU|nr:hydroxysqualene dehydroxylase HpnE [Pseudonocardia sulfidoxydans]GEL21929.1 phytoene dehydrogenase [Pseudonocardia sulfidoxydans NBRC 16205]